MLDKLSFYLKHSINDLRVNKQRTLFALLCIAAGVAAIVSLQTLGVMIKYSLTGSLRESNRADIRIMPSVGFGNQDEIDEDARTSEGLVARGENEFDYYFTPEGLATIEAWFSEKTDSPVRMTYLQAMTGSSGGISLSIPAKDTDKSIVQPYFVEAAHYPLYGERRAESGTPLRDLLQNPSDIVINRSMADDLNAEVGDTIRLNGARQDFTLRGILPDDAESGFENILGNIFGYYFVDVSAAALFANMEPNTAALVYVALDDLSPAEVDALGIQFKAEYSYVSVTTTADLEEQNSQISATVGEMVTIMGLVSMLIGGIGIVNTMLVIVSRRTIEVAVLKTLGLEPEEVTTLFLVEAIIMGVLGGILGILAGWGMAFALRGIPSRFVAQTLDFRFALAPVLNGFVVGILITTIFGFLPTLAAGQVRPASVLRPSDAILPKNGRLRSFAALMGVLFALSLVVQGLIGGLLDSNTTIGSSIETANNQLLEDDPNAEITSNPEDLPAFIRDIKYLNLVTGINGVIIGFLLVVPVILGGFFSMREGRRGRSWLLHLLLWVALFFALPGLGFVFGYLVPSIIIVSLTFIFVGCLYLLLMLLIWAVGGGSLAEFPILGNLPGVLRVLSFLFFPLWTGLIVLVITLFNATSTITLLFLGLLFFIHIPAIIVTLTLPGWVLGQLFQRFGFLDLKIALRAMVATKGRGASTLLALVIGIFTLSMITMLVDRILAQFDQLIEEQTGGNVLIFPGEGEASLGAIEEVLQTQEGVNSYSVLRIFSSELLSVTDVSEETTLDIETLRQRVIDQLDAGSPFIDGEDLANTFEFSFNSIDSRELGANLPDVKFYAGRQLDPVLDTEPQDGFWSIVISANEPVLAAGIDVGDLLTFSLSGNLADKVTFRVVGMIDETGGSVQGVVSDNYAPIVAFKNREPDETFLIADVDEAQISTVRRTLSEIPAVFVLETRVFNELITSIINQFTSFPILVAVLALATGGIVIANSVALSTLERRREIGIMKAVGVQRERVLGMLLLENGIMGFVGGLIGVGTGVLMLVFTLTQVFDSSLGDAIPLQTAFILMAICIGIALVAALLTVWGASGEKPLNVLRYE